MSEKSQSTSSESSTPTHDPRIFSWLCLVIYDSDTLEVVQTIRPIPKGTSLENVKTTFGKFSMGIYNGKVPPGRLKFIDGKFHTIPEPQMFLDIDTPFFTTRKSGELIPILVKGNKYQLILRVCTEDGRLYNDVSKKIKTRLYSTPQKVILVREFSPRGLTKTTIRLGNLEPGEAVLFEAKSDVLDSVSLEALYIDDEIK